MNSMHAANSPDVVLSEQNIILEQKKKIINNEVSFAAIIEFKTPLDKRSSDKLNLFNAHSRTTRLLHVSSLQKRLRGRNHC